jgi:hypothetical protein
MFIVTPERQIQSSGGSDMFQSGFFATNPLQSAGDGYSKTAGLCEEPGRCEFVPAAFRSASSVQRTRTAL